MNSTYFATIRMSFNQKYGMIKSQQQGGKPHGIDQDIPHSFRLSFIPVLQ